MLLYGVAVKIAAHQRSLSDWAPLWGVGLVRAQRFSFADICGRLTFFGRQRIAVYSAVRQHTLRPNFVGIWRNSVGTGTPSVREVLCCSHLSIFKEISLNRQQWVFFESACPDSTWHSVVVPSDSASHFHGARIIDVCLLIAGGWTGVWRSINASQLFLFLDVWFLWNSARAGACHCLSEIQHSRWILDSNHSVLIFDYQLKSLIPARKSNTFESLYNCLQPMTELFSTQNSLGPKPLCGRTLPEFYASRLL